MSRLQYQHNLLDIVTTSYTLKLCYVCRNRDIQKLDIYMVGAVSFKYFFDDIISKEEYESILLRAVPKVGWNHDILLRLCSHI